MSDELLVHLAGGTALVALMAYALFGGADFGGGVWDLFATGPRKQLQRDVIAHAMGPVWEANHVWLILLLVVLFTCFPNGYGPLAIALFIPFHLALFGIMLRGASFVFRNYSRKSKLTDAAAPLARLWGTVFGVASLISPLLLGVAFGVLTQGEIRVSDTGQVHHEKPLPWLSFYAIGCGMLALSTCAYLAAVYLTYETSGDSRGYDDRRFGWGRFRRHLLRSPLVLRPIDEPPLPAGAPRRSILFRRVGVGRLWAAVLAEPGLRSRRDRRAAARLGHRPIAVLDLPRHDAHGRSRPARHDRLPAHHAPLRRSHRRPKPVAADEGV
jgi:hypothetical protein